MNNVHGLIYAYHSYPGMGALIDRRTGASMPFCGRYRLIDFALSGMKNAGITDVGVVLQNNYISLMDHLRGGRSWNMDRHGSGLHLLPPFGLAHTEKGAYAGSMEALSAVAGYLEDNIRQEYVLLTRGDLCANVDMKALVDAHIASGADITALCTGQELPYPHNRFVLDGEGRVTEHLNCPGGSGRGVASLEMYVMRYEKLMELVRWSMEGSYLYFHRDALHYALKQGWRIETVLHPGYALHITRVEDYYRANMDMLDAGSRRSLFAPERRITTQTRSDVSTYYGDESRVSNSLIADGCIINGTVENCVIFRGVKVAPGAVLRDCIVLNDSEIGENVELKSVIADKNVTIDPYVCLSGSPKLPLVIPKGAHI